MEFKSKIFVIVDVPYDFKDDKGEQRKGTTRKAAVIEYEENGDVHSLYTAKCMDGFDAPLKQMGYLNYDRFGRISGFRPAQG